MLEWVGATVLVLYAALNISVAWAVLLGVIGAAGAYNHPAEWGHAALWDPLFLLWGVLLAGGLWRTRSAPPVSL